MNLSELKPVSTWHKRDAVAASLRQLALKLGPGTRMPRVRELGRTLGVPMATLDQVLRILEEGGVIVRRQRSGIFVANQRPRRIGLAFGDNLLKDPASSFHSLFLESCRKRATTRGEQFSCFIDVAKASDGVNPDLADAIAHGKLDGVLAVTLCDEQEAWLRKQNLPVVALGPKKTWPHRVVLDGGQLTELAISELKSRGCNTVGVFAPVQGHIHFFRQALKRLNMESSETWVISGGPMESNNEERGIKAALDFLRRNDGKSLPDGMVITDDIMGRGVCAAFVRKGIKLGETIKIASHANRGSWALSEWERNLILCEYDPGEIAEAMFLMLEQLINKNDVDIQPAYVRAHVRRSLRETDSQQISELI